MNGIPAFDPRAIASAVAPLKVGSEKSEMMISGLKSLSSRRKSDSVSTLRLWKASPARFSSRSASSASDSTSSTKRIRIGAVDMRLVDCILYNPYARGLQGRGIPNMVLSGFPGKDHGFIPRGALRYSLSLSAERSGMNGMGLPRTAAQILVDALKIHGVDTAFCVPGESYLAVLDALYDARDYIRLIVARQDGGAAYMAEAYGKVTGKPGICFVTRGPGATNASIGVHTAHQDSTPMILFIGQVPGEFADREAFQEMDYRHMFGPMAKWVAQIDRPERMHEYVSHAFHLAMSGRPGPVVLALPEDMLTQTAGVADVSPYQIVQASPSGGDMDKLGRMLERAKQPLVILGGTVWTREACSDLQAFAESSGLPVACSFRFQDLFDNRHDHYVGDVGIGINPKLAERWRTADLLPVTAP